MSIDYTAIYSALYSRAATDSAGATLRALLGGSSSLFERSQLANVAGRVFPWLVWVAGGVGGQSGGMRDLNASWFIYAAPTDSTRTLHTIAAALEDLYGERQAIAFGELQGTFVGAPFVDTSLANAQGMEFRFQFLQRG